MIDNETYNLLMQLVEENQSLWRIKNDYIDEASCDDCKNFWKKMQEDKEGHIDELEKRVRKHLE